MRKHSKALSINLNYRKSKVIGTYTITKTGKPIHCKHNFIIIINNNRLYFYSSFHIPKDAVHLTEMGHRTVWARPVYTMNIKFSNKADRKLPMMTMLVFAPPYGNSNSMLVLS